MIHVRPALLILWTAVVSLVLISIPAVSERTTSDGVDDDDDDEDADVDDGNFLPVTLQIGEKPTLAGPTFVT